MFFLRYDQVCHVFQSKSNPKFAFLDHNPIPASFVSLMIRLFDFAVKVMSQNLLPRQWSDLLDSFSRYFTMIGQNIYRQVIARS